MERQIKMATCHPDRKHSAQGLCQACYARQRRTSPEYLAKESAYKKQYYKANKVEMKEKERNCRYKRQYGKTDADYSAIFALQNGVCASCGSPQEAGRRLHWDHNHTTNIVRSLLCRGCNTALGSLKESPSRIRSLLAYCEKHQSCSPPQPNSQPLTSSLVPSENHQ